MNQEQLIKHEIELNHYLQANLIKAQIKKYGKPVVVFTYINNEKGGKN